MSENKNWFDHQLKNAAKATENWPEWMKREAGISQTASAPQPQPQPQTAAPPPSRQVGHEQQTM